MKRPVIVVLVLATLALVTTLALGGVALAQTPTPPAGSDGAKTPWIGVSLVELNERVAARLGISQTAGVAVVSVTADSPAAKAGVREKDVITAVDGKPVTKAGEVSAAVKSKTIGDSIAITVVRDGKTENLNVVVGELAQPKGRVGSGKAPNTVRPEAKSPFGGLLDGLKGLTPGEAFGRMLGSQRRFLDENNQTVTIKSIPGTVVSAGKDSLTIKPNDSAESGGPYAITSDTQVRLSGNAGVDSLKAGDQVVVVTADGKTALSVTSGVRGAFGDWMGGRMSPHGSFGRGFDRGSKPAPTTPKASS